MCEEELGGHASTSDLSGLNKASLYPPLRSPHPNYSPDTSTLLHLLLFLTATPPPSAHHPVPSSDQGCPFAVLKAPEACTISGCWWRLLHSLLLELHQECVSSSIDIKSLLFSQKQWKVHSKFKIKSHFFPRSRKNQEDVTK